MSTYLTALSDSIIQAGKGEWSSSMKGGIRTPVVAFGSIYGPSSNPPFFNTFSVSNKPNQNFIIIHILKIVL